MRPLYAVISSGAAVSGTVDATKFTRGIGAMNVPVMTSGDLMLQGAIDTTSANFYRFIETRAVGSGDLKFATGPGSRFVPVPSGLLQTLPPYIRVEAAVAQTDNRTITLLSR